MPDSYDHRIAEAKWQSRWEDSGAHHVDFSDADDKLYSLVMFTYPSGDRLHIGHWFNFSPLDSWSRFQRMRGKTVFEPMGFDAFGLPAENFAIKTGAHPKDITGKNTRTMEKQLRAMGAMYDWSKTVNTSRPEYYKWTQWLFLFLHKKGLAYRKKAPVNWCPSCMTVLANEQAKDGLCERCDTEVTKKDLTQWFFKITDFSQRLLDGLEKVDWPDKTVVQQRNWIGRSEGAEITFALDGHNETVTVFTTRADTLFGATYMVLAPEHPLVEKLTTPGQKKEVANYQDWTRKQSDIERLSTERKKTGVFTGAFAVNPANGEKIPVWIADYVLATYGTGAVMAVPAHDVRDYAFAVKFKLHIRWVIRPPDMEGEDLEATLPQGDAAYTDYGIMINSGNFDGMSSEKGKNAVVAHLEKKKQARLTINYRLRDWLISRQRYWGAPIPMLFCEKCGEVPEKEENLPVELPYDINLKLSTSGISPLAAVESFVKSECPSCGGTARREVDTMDTFVCSSWYFLRYLSPGCEDKPFDLENVKKWMPVDLYCGGAEHTVLHLMYARFVTMALYDAGMVPCEEPFKKLVHQGTITKDGKKMSKSHGNVVSPDEYIDKYGADVFRLYLMFMGPFFDGGDWSDSGITGLVRFRDKVWRLFSDFSTRKEFPEKTDAKNFKDFLRLKHYTIREVTKDIDGFSFNTAISKLMEWYNFLFANADKFSKDDVNDALKHFNLLLAPLAPHFGEELWEKYTSPPGPLSLKGEGESMLPASESSSPSPPKERGLGGEVKAQDEVRTTGETKSPGYIFEFARNLRKTETDSEKLLWACLRNRQLQGFKFKRQYPINRYIADFYCFEANLIVEIEGGIHKAKGQKEYDKIRFEALDGAGFEVLRLKTDDVLSDPEEILKIIAEKLKGKTPLTSVFSQPWPSYEEQYIQTDTVSLAVQVNGKRRGQIELPRDASKNEAQKAAFALEAVSKRMSADDMKKFIHVPNRLVNLVGKEKG